MKTIKLLTIGALAVLGACSPTPRLSPEQGQRYLQCVDQLEELQRRNAGINRRARAAEAAYMATRDSKIAAANAADLKRDDEQLAADLAEHTARCRS